MKISIIIFFISYFFISFIGCEKKLSTSPPQLIPQNSGKLFVKSTPPAAKIYLNGRNTGYITPDTVPYLNSGTYKLTTKLNYFKDSTQLVEIRKDSTTSVFFDYISNPTMRGFLYIDSDPRGADIFINDSSTGMITPYEFSDLLPGIYHVELRKTGFWNGHSTAAVITDRTFRINIVLEDTMVFVNYRTSNSDIPTDYINCIAIDQEGNKWIADSYNLIRFDDINWKIYNSSNSDYPGGNVKSIIALGDEICISTINGLVIFNNGIFQFIDSQAGLPSDYVYCCNKDSQNNLWIGTNNGLCKYDITPIIFNTTNSGLPSNSVTAIQFDDLGNIWIGTAGGGIALYNKSNWVVFNSGNTGLPVSNKITDISLLNSSFIWVSYNSAGLTSPGGSAFYNGSDWASFQSVPSGNISKVVIQSPNLIWFSNFDSGLTKYENGTWYTYSTSNSRISSNRDFGLAIDQNGWKWIATFGGGLSKYKGN